MSSQRGHSIKLEIEGKSDYDPLDESIIECHQENEDAVVKK